MPQMQRSHQGRLPQKTKEYQPFSLLPVCQNVRSSYDYLLLVSVIVIIIDFKTPNPKQGELKATNAKVPEGKTAPKQKKTAFLVAASVSKLVFLL